VSSPLRSAMHFSLDGVAAHCGVFPLSLLDKENGVGVSASATAGRFADDCVGVVNIFTRSLANPPPRARE